MTVASEAFFTDWFLADGVTKDWSYDFGIISSSHVRVLVRDGTDDTTVVEYNSGFSFFPAADYGSGVVRYPASGLALAAGKQVRILRQMDFLQSTEIGMEGSFAPILHERAFDKLTMQTQQLKEDAKRSMKSPLGTTGYEFSSGFLDYQTFMKLGNLIVPGPSATQIENAETNAKDAIAAKVAAEAARDLAAGYVANFNLANYYTKTEIDDHLETELNTLSAAIEAIDPWSMQPIGAIIALDAGETVAAPPTDKAYRYVELTAGLTGTGGYNNGVLTSETVFGSAPNINATAVVSLVGSPLNGKTIRLLNTERRFLRPGSPGTLEESQNLAHSHTGSTSTDGAHTHTTGATVSGSGSTNPTGGSSGYNFSTSGSTNSAGAHSHTVTINSDGGNEARPRNVGVKFYRRVK